MPYMFVLPRYGRLFVVHASRMYCSKGDKERSPSDSLAAYAAKGAARSGIEALRASKEKHGGIDSG
jgi:hypothetical protein